MDYIQEIINLCCDYTIGGKTINEESYNEFARIMQNHFCRFEKDCSNLVATNPYIISKLKAALEYFCLFAKEIEEEHRQTQPNEDGVYFCTCYLAMQLKCRIFLDVINCFPSIRSLNQFNASLGCRVRWEPKDLQDALDFLDAPLEPQQSTGTPQESEIVLPPELSTDEAKRVFQKAIEAGLMEKRGNGYKWNKTKSLLAVFADEMSDRLKLGKGTKTIKNCDVPRTSWKPFEVLFDVKNLRGAKNDIDKTGQDPIGKKEVIKIFDL